MAFGFKDKHKHYTDVASGKEPVKQDSKYSEAEQRAYARGQRDAMNEARRVTAYKNASQKQREEYAAKRAVERERFKASRKGK